MLLNQLSRPQKTKPFRFKNHFKNEIDFDFKEASRSQKKKPFRLKIRF